MRKFSSEGLEILQPGISLQVKNTFKAAMKLEGGARPLMIETILNSINMAFGILCFTQRRDNLLMWSHYSNSHRGFVLEFFPDHSFFDQRKTQDQIAGHLKEVRYTLKRPEFCFFDPAFSQGEIMENFINNLFWVKSFHWNYEEEWRILTTLDRSEKTIENQGMSIHLFSFPLDAIKSIFLGCKMIEENKIEFISLLENEENLKHIKVY
jgi:hypothetical protein